MTANDAQFPWDDSTFWQKLMILSHAAGFAPRSVRHMHVCRIAVVIWADPYKLIFDGDGRTYLAKRGA